IKGMEEKLTLDDPVSGDVYNMTDVPEIPNTLRQATEALRGSKMLRAAMGDDVIDHYTRCAEVEQEMFDAAVTDWEIQRGFERA
ncbi:MAG TPA: glutamine synthetase, partial [Marivita sp.]|nr:glutamine synthetase [Marivita sp.]